MKKQDILKKYEIEEDRLIIAKVLDKLELVSTKNYMLSTDFLNLHEQKLIEDLLIKEKIQNFFFYGGDADLERKLLFIYPDKLTEEIARMQCKNFLKIIRIELPKYNNENYTHRDYLGGMMKLGIKREKTGDILTYSGGADIIVEKEISAFLKTELQNLTRFRKANIDILEINELKKPELNFEEITIIVPSLRMDSIVSELAHTSRTKALDIINEERVFINFEVCLDRSKILKVNDVISIRGKGRFKIEEEIGSTKKDNIRLKILKNV